MFLRGVDVKPHEMIKLATKKKRGKGHGKTANQYYLEIVREMMTMEDGKQEPMQNYPLRMHQAQRPDLRLVALELNTLKTF